MRHKTQPLKEIKGKKHRGDLRTTAYAFLWRKEMAILVLDTMAYTDIPVPLSLWDMQYSPRNLDAYTLEGLSNNII